MALGASLAIASATRLTTFRRPPSFRSPRTTRSAVAAARFNAAVGSSSRTTSTVAEPEV